MNNTKIEQLRAQVKAAAETNAVKLQEAVEIARLEATIKLESNPALFEAKVRMAAKGAQTAQLQALVEECTGLVTSVPVFNSKTRANRVWAGTHRYGYGTQIDLMYQLATGILYSCAEHKQLLLAHTGLDLEMLEQFVEAFGSPMYYSRNHHTIVDAKQYDLESVVDTVNVLQSELGVVVDTSKLTADQFEYEFLRAENTAHTALEQAEEAISEAEFTVM